MNQQRLQIGDTVRLFTRMAAPSSGGSSGPGASHYAAKSKDAPRSFTGTAVSNRTVRAMVLDPSGLKLGEFNDRGRPLLFEHGQANEPSRIGNVTKLGWTAPQGPGGLRLLSVSIDLPPPGVSEEADRLALRMAAGLGNSLSVGFQITGLRSATSAEKSEAAKRGENQDFASGSKYRDIVTSWSLQELSAVSLGADSIANLHAPAAPTSRRSANDLAKLCRLGGELLANEKRGGSRSPRPRASEPDRNRSTSHTTPAETLERHIGDLFR